jgi:hypothetical protein
MARGTPRVHVQRLARLGLPLVQLVELAHRHEHLAAHLDGLRPASPGEPRRRSRYRADVRRDVLSGRAVAPGRCAHQDAAAVDQRDRQAVDLQLAQVRAGPEVRCQPLGPRRPGVKFLGRERVVQAEQPLQVLDRSEVGGDQVADLLRRRVRRAQLRVTVLQAAQLPHERVVVGVGDQR